MLTYADVCWRILTYADVCLRFLRKGLLAYLTAANARLLCTSPLLPPAPRGTSRDTPPTTSAPEAAAAAGGALRFSVYLLYWYNSTNTDAAGAVTHSLSTPPPPSQSVTPPRLFDGQGGRRGKWRARSVARLLLRYIFIY